mgnify:FL=1
MSQREETAAVIGAMKRSVIEASRQAKVALALLCALALSVSAAEAAKRVALVIGNDTYETLPALNNARADAKGMAEKLRGLGFDVILKLNASSPHYS